MKSRDYKMIEEPSRGSLKEGVTFGYVDLPANMTPKDRPFLDKLTADSLALQKKIRSGREIEIKYSDTMIKSKWGDTPVRIYIPEGKGNLPMVMYYHGGGFAIRNIECFDYIGKYIAKHANAVVFLIDYSLTPEHKYPIQAEQSYDALLWARANAHKYGANPQKDFVVGDSAGGNLSAVVTLMCRDRGERTPSKQILAYPVVDMTIGDKRKSEELYGSNYNLDYKHLVSYNKAYVNNMKDLEAPYVSPLLADDLSKLSPCFLISAECDILIDQGMEYIWRLKEAGVKADYKIVKGMPHDFLFYGFEESYQSYDLICDLIRS